MYFDEDMMNLIREQSELYSSQKINQTLLWILHLWRFLAVSILSGCHSLSQENLYCSTFVDAQMPAVSFSMSKRSFRETKKCRHLADNTALPPDDKNEQVKKIFQSCISKNNPLPVTSLFLIFNDVLESQLLFSNPIVLPSVVSVLMNRETSTQRFGLDTGFVSTTNFDNLTNGTEYYGLVKMICLPASTLLLVTTTWMTVSFIIYGFKIRKKRHKEKTFLSGTSRWWTILLLFSVLPRLAATLSLAFVGYKKTPQASFLCELTMDISIAAYGLGVFPTYLNLWLRQRALYSQPLLQEIDTALVRYLSWGLFTCLTVGDVVAVVIYLLPRAYAGSRYGCINIEKSRYNIPHYVAIVMQITGQLSLLALFLYPLWVHKRVQETFRFSKRKHKITAVGVSSDVVLHTIMKSFRCTFACILSDLTAMITAAFIIPLALPRFLTNIVYDFNLTFNMIVTVLTFQNYRKVLKAVFGRCSK